MKKLAILILAFAAIASADLKIEYLGEKIVKNTDGKIKEKIVSFEETYDDEDFTTKKEYVFGIDSKTLEITYSGRNDSICAGDYCWCNFKFLNKDGVTKYYDCDSDGICIQSYKPTFWKDLPKTSDPVYELYTEMKKNISRSFN